MPSTKSFKSPHATSFKSAVRRGTPASVAVANIARRSSSTPVQIFQSLFKAGLVQRQKINGQWIYWPVEGHKAPSTVSKQAQSQLWQAYVDWAISSGIATPQQIASGTGSQQQFIAFQRKFFNRQFTSSTTSSSRSSSSRSTRSSSSTTRSRSTTRRTTRRPTSTRSSLRLSGSRSSRTTTRRYRRAA